MHRQQLSKNLQNGTIRFDFDRWKWLLALGIILLLTFFAYIPVLQNGLLAWDDEAYIKNNPLIYSLNLKDIFTNNVMGNWHPITILTLSLEYHLFGMNETGYHAVNLLLHLLNVILVFYTVSLLSDKMMVAVVASLLFGIHPLHVESVAWVAELKDLLYTFFFLASYIFYLKYLKGFQKKYYLFALLLFAVSLLSKAMAASLPLLLILTDYFKGRKITMRTLIEKAPFFLLALVVGVVAVLVQKDSGSTEFGTSFTFPQRLIFASYGFITYLFKLLLPLNLSAFYPYPDKITVIYYAYLVFVLCMAAFLVYSRRYSKKIIFGMGFFTITILLVLQILPVGRTIMADRYSYLPSIGVFYLAGEGFAYLWSRKLKLSGILLLTVAAVLFSVKTYSRCGVWKNDLTLWNDVIRQYNTVAEAYYNRGVFFMNERRNGEAINDFNRAIELKPGSASAHNNRGIVYVNKKRLDEAIADFNKAIELNPSLAIAYNNRGNFFKNANRNNEAISDFNKAVKLDPDCTEAYNNRGSVFISERRFDEAINDLNKVIELSPGHAEAYFNRGIIFISQRRNEEAVRDFNKAIKLKPDFANAYRNRGIVFASENRNKEAVSDFTMAIELKPDYATAYNNRGMVYASEKRNDEAIKDYEKAIDLKPDYSAAYHNIGNLFFEEKRYEEAVINYTKAVTVDPGFAPAYYKRGLSELYSGKKTIACIDLKQALTLGYKPAGEALSRYCN